MARITVEDCLTKENNRFALVHLAAKRTKQLLQGAKVLTDAARGNKAVVSALREIADGKVRFMSEEEARLAREQESRLALAAGPAAEAAAGGGNGNNVTVEPAGGAEGQLKAPSFDSEDGNSSTQS